MRTQIARNALRRGLAMLGLVVTVASVTAGSSVADVRFSTMTDPSVDVSAEPASLPDRLAGLLGTAAPEVTTERRAHLFRALGVRRPALAATRGIAHTAAFVDSLPEGKGDAEWECLAEALYFEARGEDVAGVFAVAEVILNRVDDGRFPSTICGVVNQGGSRGCQFSYNCDGIADKVHEAAAWTRVGKIARVMVDGGERVLTDGATFYHTKAVSPSWSRVFVRTTTIGAHHFYAQG